MMPRVKLLLIALIALCSPACGQVAKQVPVVVGAAYCPQPHKPQLPRLNNDLPLDHIANIKPLLLRDDVLRQYISGLEDTINCYEGQVKQNATASK